MSKHNKKRNVGLVYEMLLNYIAENIISDNYNEAKKAVKILERRYNNKTELYKEYRLLNALVNTTIDETHVAASILSEAKRASRRFDHNKLMKEKSLLIRDINYQLEARDFFNKNVKNYRAYATTQMLINEWSKEDNSDLKKIIDYERSVVEHLIKDKKVYNVFSENLDRDDVNNRLVFKILTKKINEKYDNKLSLEQKEIIKNYAIYHNDDVRLKDYLKKLKTKTLSEVKNYKSKSTNKVLLSKMDSVIDKINELNTDVIDSDGAISKFLTLSALKDHIMRGESWMIN